MQITQELREYAQKHQLDEQEAAQVCPAGMAIWDANFRASGLPHSKPRLVLIIILQHSCPLP